MIKTQLTVHKKITANNGKISALLETRLSSRQFMIKTQLTVHKKITANNGKISALLETRFVFR